MEHVCSIELHEEIVKTIVKTIEFKHLGVFSIWGVPLPALQGERIFEKRTTIKKQSTYRNNPSDFNEFRARTEFNISTWNDTQQRQI